MSGYIEFQNVSKFYKMGDQRISALDEMNFAIDKGEFCVIVGPSGAGKTTLLNILGGMDRCDEGRVYLDGREIGGLDTRGLTEYRRYDVGFVFQFYNLVQNLTALENVELASEICRDPLDCRAVLKEVGLADRTDNFPAQLSGGEQQRVAIARALAKNPKVLLCDEPTGALDYSTGKTILQLLHVKHSVIATGGSVVYGPRAMQNLRNEGMVVFLDVPLGEIEKRIGDYSQRGISLKEGQSIEDLFEERRPLYMKYADIIVNTTDTELSSAAETVRSLVEEEWRKL